MAGLHAYTLRGQIIYQHDTDGERGREWFTVTVSPEGVRTVRAQCEMDDAALLRDVVYSVDRHWNPLDCFVRLTQHGTFVGSSWFHFTDSRISCEGYTATEGRVSQSFDVAFRPPTFAPHPVMTDAWQCARFDHERAERTQQLSGTANPSPLADGGSGPMLSMSGKSITYMGEETLTVPAGTFAAQRYRLDPRDYPAWDMWIIDEDFTLGRLRWDHLATTYDLVSFARCS